MPPQFSKSSTVQSSSLLTGNIFTEYVVLVSLSTTWLFCSIFLQIIDGRSATDSSVVDEIRVDGSAMK